MDQRRRWGRILVVMKPEDEEVERLVECLKVERPWDILRETDDRV